MTNIELKPCPCCGGKAKSYYDDPYDGYQGNLGRYFIGCTECNLRTSDFSSLKKAAEAWNERAEERNAKYVFKIEVDCYETIDGQYKWKRYAAEKNDAALPCPRCGKKSKWTLCGTGLEDSIEDAFKAAYHVQWNFTRHNPHVDDRNP